MKRIIIVTGASSGIGKEFALRLAAEREADEIWLIARRKDRLEALIPAISAFGKAIPRAIPIDLGGKPGVAAFYRLLEEERAACGTGGFIVDALVNNAGFGTYGKFADTDAERELEMIDLNVYTLTGLCHAALPFMRKGSVIINVASLAGFSPLGNLAVYAATKAYVLSFSVALAAELADSGILVSTVCPGPVDTEFSFVASGGVREKVVDGKSPEALVRHALRSIKAGKRIAIMAPKWKFKAFMSRFVGRFAIALHSSRHDTRPAAPNGGTRAATGQAMAKPDFVPVPLPKAYELVTPGMPVLVASRGLHYNLAPIAWNCPLDYDPVTKLLFVCDPAHQTAINVKATGEFAVAIPASPDDPLIAKCGSVSDPQADKFARFGIGSIKAEKIDVRVPEGAAAWIECKLIRVIPEGSVEIFLGEAIAAHASRKE